MNFATLKGLTIPEGVVTQIADASGRVLWMLPVAGGPVILEVEKITSDTHAGGTTYTGEQFILLDIYPKTNGTVTVTYGGLTKTITDTSGVEEPNAQQVFFGTFNGVSDSVTTPASGELTIEGDYTAFCGSSYQKSKIATLINICCPICKVKSFGAVNKIPQNAFGSFFAYDQNKFNQTSIKIPSHIVSIGDNAFYGCQSLQSIQISNGVRSVGGGAFYGPTLQKLEIPPSVESIAHNPLAGFMASGAVFENNFISVAESNTHYKVDGSCLIETLTNRLICGFSDSIIPAYVTEIGAYAFYAVKLQSITIPSGVTKIGDLAFNSCSELKEIILLPTTPPTLSSAPSTSVPTFIVPKGCGEVYKAAEFWSEVADKIMEVS